MVDAVLDDGVIWQVDNTNLIQASANKKSSSIREFREYVKHAPTVFSKLHIGATNSEFYKTSIVLKRVSPFGVYQEDIIPIEDYYKPENFNKDKVEITRKFQLDNETVMYILLPANTTVTMSFVAGVALNPGVALTKKIEKATKGHKTKKLKGIVSNLHRKGFRWLRRPGRRPHGRRIMLFRLRNKR